MNEPRREKSKADYGKIVKKRHNNVDVKKAKSFYRARIEELLEGLRMEELDLQKLVNPTGSGSGGSYPDLVDKQYRHIVCRGEGYNCAAYRLNQKLDAILGEGK